MHACLIEVLIKYIFDKIIIKYSVFKKRY